MLYSRYYPRGTPPTTQEDQARLAAEKVIPPPTTEEDQLIAAGYTLPLVEAEPVKVEEPEPEIISTEAPASAEVVSTETPVSAEVAEQEIVEVTSGEISEAIEARVHELVNNTTVPELREMAKQYGLDVPPRIKEENLARMIATHEQG
jgi:cell division ATPase FtsA